MPARKFSLILIFSIILTLGLSISLGSLLAAWTSPASAPPEGNIATPINRGATGQDKIGGLVLSTDVDAENGLIVQYGNVGIGTTNPQAQLDVVGNINASGNISSAAPTASDHLATKGYVDAASGGSEYVQGNAVYFTVGGNNYYCSQRTVSAAGMVAMSNVNENQPCDTNKYCRSGECVSTGDSGVACTAGSQCSSGYCVDGYCCNSACNTTCVACNVAGSIGTCINALNDTDPHNTCNAYTCTNYQNGPTCYSYANATSHNGMCNGAGVCYTLLADSCTGQAAATTNYSAGLYSCTNSNQRCYGGSCITCGGWVNAGYCWYNAGYRVSCTAACSSHGGVYNGSCDWVNDPADCSTCRHWYNYGCSIATGVAPYSDNNFGTGYPACLYHGDGTNDCDWAYPSSDRISRQCACNQ